MSKTTIRKGKQDDKFSLAMREVQSSVPENKKCFDCEQRGPTYVNTTVGSFVCTKCSGMLRGINPPHRIKSISMSTFTPEEVELMRTRGNLWCSRVWLGNYEASTNPVDYKDDEKIKEFMITKYERKRYYVEANQRLAQTSPSVSSLSSSSSQDSKPISGLIGTTLKAYIAQGQSSISVSRPAATASFPRPQEVKIPAQPIQKTSVPAQPTQKPPVSAQPTIQSQEDSFANFANFDSVAFDSLPADPLAAPVVLPTPSILQSGKPSQVINKTSDFSTPPNNPSSCQQDRYSALKELDDLFKTTAIQSPGPTESSSQPQFFSGASAIPPTALPKSNGIFSDVNGRNSPSFPNSSPANWSNSAPVWTPSWNQGGGGGGWPATAEPAWGTSGNHTTNPFGSSPSGAINLENNNDLFAGSSKQFFTEKPGFEGSGAAGNPWSSVPVFTPNMTPAPNPHNPFL
ncbi:arf-GAP domain and FG repeat-containing protein 2 isoform X2 [Eurytemora carolleeae]|uniref:arf-GAP domain and FG repeat-containing protein 2 isoform X2 n=1 Tax=Eurytemora carolleeae TaxID=1294199 RepID=UPI000C782659|nr:arf-GAP domain and FG repeat-containing protein 2 isoform X2 [Eurytemora carolleeae]|eukprot:XP_023323652.1 arf-GAP domain and FG repeat-containing protein 2-like isoform X2 [Eurytemora affinis]